MTRKAQKPLDARGKFDLALAAVADHGRDLGEHRSQLPRGPLHPLDLVGALHHAHFAQERGCVFEARAGKRIHKLEVDRGGKHVELETQSAERTETAPGEKAGNPFTARNGTISSHALSARARWSERRTANSGLPSAGTNITPFWTVPVR